jgi:hypothetical protein
MHEHLKTHSSIALEVRSNALTRASTNTDLANRPNENRERKLKVMFSRSHEIINMKIVYSTEE